MRGPDPRRPPPLPCRRRSVASRGARARPRPPARLPVRPAQRRHRGDAARLPAREGRRPRYGAPLGRLRRPGGQEALARPGEALPLRPDRRGRSAPGPAQIARPDPAAGRALEARRFDPRPRPGRLGRHLRRPRAPRPRARRGRARHLRPGRRPRHDHGGGRAGRPADRQDRRPGFGGQRPDLVWRRRRVPDHLRLREPRQPPAPADRRRPATQRPGRDDVPAERRPPSSDLRRRRRREHAP